MDNKERCMIKAKDLQAKGYSQKEISEKLGVCLLPGHRGPGAAGFLDIASFARTKEAINKYIKNESRL